MVRLTCFAIEVLFVAAFVLPGFAARRQATPSAYKTTEISTFVGYSSVSPDVYTRTRPTGLVFGADITRHFNLPVVPSLEARVNISSSPAASEHTYLFGFRAEPRTIPKFSRLHPYADLLAGRGTVHFANPTSGYLGDNSFVLSYGGGIDFNVAKNFSLKVDYQRSHWNTGEVTTKPGTLTFGISYRFPFKPHVSQVPQDH